MKRVLILLFIVLAAGAFIGEKMVQDPGYVLLSFNNTTIETSVWVLLLLTFFGFLITHWTVNLFFRIGIPGQFIGRWRKARIASSAQKRTFKGLIALSEGQWWQAQRLLSQTAPIAAQPLINYLGAAKAAHEQGNAADTDEFFAKARAIAPAAEVSISLQEVDVLMDRGNSAQALITLKRLHSLAPKHTGILRHLAELYQNQQDWDGLIALMSKLRKHQVFATEQLAAMEANCYRQMLTTVVKKLPIECSTDVRVKALTRGWKALPNALNQTAAMKATYASALNAANAPDDAEKFLRTQIKRDWDNQLIGLYGTLQTSDPTKHYNTVAGWLKKQPTHAALQLCAARLAMFNEKWQIAVQHYQSSIDLQPKVEAYRGLARLLESLGEHEKSLEMNQKAMDLTEDDSPLIPLPAPLETPAKETDQIAESTAIKIEEKPQTASA